MTLPIDSITVRLVPHTQYKKGRYTTGDVDPDMVSMITEVRCGGVVGYGEGIPTSIIYEPGHIGRSGIDEWQVIQDTAKNLIGQDARRLRALIPDELNVQDANTLVDAIDFAMHDAVGKAVGLPAWALLGPTKRSYVMGMPVVHVDTPDAMAENAATMHARGGYRWFKLKPIGDLEADREAMTKIRERTTPDVRFFADPNYALKMDLDGVIHYVNELHKLGLVVIEDPIDTDWAGYRAIQQRTPVHVMIDEKARTPQNVLEIVQENCARFINIHANWAGGFASGLKKAHLAAAAGLGVIIGSSGYIGIGNAAYQTLSSVLPSEQPCEQTNTSDDNRRSVVAKPYHTEDGRIHIADAPGLGIEVDTDLLEEMTTEKVTF